MKDVNHKLIAIFTSGALILAFGCKKTPIHITPLSEGYGVTASWIGVDSGPTAKLYFTDQNGSSTLLWPFFGPSSGEIQISNQIAFFSADLPDEKGRVGTGAYFAVEGPGPVLDISMDLLKIWADSNHLNFSSVINKNFPVTEERTQDGIHLAYAGAFYSTPADFVVTWSQISNIVADVKRTGKRHVTTAPATVYLRKDYDEILTNNVAGSK